MDIMMMNLHQYLLIILLGCTKVWSLEEPHREIYLQPRNFNPHPYEADTSQKNSLDRGPILFPPSPPTATEKSNFIKIERKEHPIDSYPYSKLVRKHKYRNPGRHQDFENQINPQISRALAGHAKKVLGHSKIDDPDVSSSNEQKNYAFSYKVVDHLTGDDFSHTQSQNEKATSGEYRVKLPDGRVQIVSYTADKNGYKADVKYQDDDASAREPQHRNNAPVRGSRIGTYREYDGRTNGKYTFDHVGVGLRATPSVPIHENHIEDYDYDQRSEKVVYAPQPTSPAQVFPVTQTPYQAYNPTQAYDRVQYSLNLDYGDAQQANQHQPQVPHRFQIIPHESVQIVNQGAPSFSSTVAPPYLGNPGIIFSTASPQFSNEYQHVFVKSIHGAYGRK